MFIGEEVECTTRSERGREDGEREMVGGYDSGKEEEEESKKR